MFGLFTSAFVQTKMALMQFCRVESIVGGVFLVMHIPTPVTIIYSFLSFYLLTASQNVDELGLRIAVILLIFGDIDAVPDARNLKI